MDGEIRIYDFLLIGALIGTAWKALFGRQAFTATVFFIAYGLLMSVAWVQLGAIDVALAEACIGAGLTGSLLIGAIRQFERDKNVHHASRSVWKRFFLGALSVAVFSGMLLAIRGLIETESVVPRLIDENLSNAGSSHPVTAVLLNFRAFDTWLELGVLLLASVAAIAIHQMYDRSKIPSAMRSGQDQPRIIARTMLPFLIMIGGAILWFGSHSPGGAFQAGSLLGAAGILMQIGGDRSFLRFDSVGFRFVLVFGFLVFLLLSLITTAYGQRLLEYTPKFAGSAMLILEIAATFSIALTLNVMYACSHPWRSEST